MPSAGRTPTRPEPELGSHRWDVQSCFCTRCGLSAMAVVDATQEECYRPKNLIAVSHLIAKRRMNEVVEKVWGKSVLPLPSAFTLEHLPRFPHPVRDSLTDAHDGIEQRHLVRAVELALEEHRQRLANYASLAEAKIGVELSAATPGQPAVYTETKLQYGAPRPVAPDSEPV